MYGGREGQPVNGSVHGPDKVPRADIRPGKNFPGGYPSGFPQITM